LTPPLPGQEEIHDALFFITDAVFQLRDNVVRNVRGGADVPCRQNVQHWLRGTGRSPYPRRCQLPERAVRYPKRMRFARLLLT
jgi:hypothetical protein